MPIAKGRARHIIWQNSDQTVTIIDIPRSIEDAQYDGESTSPLRIASIAPVADPFTTPEPKTEAARARLLAQHPEQEEHHIYVSLYKLAVKALGGSGETSWALGRLVNESEHNQEQGQQSQRKRKHGAPESTTLSILFASSDPEHVTSTNVAGEHLAIADGEESSLDLADWPVIHNPLSEQVWLDLAQSISNEILLPPKSSLLCERITTSSRGTTLRQAFRARHGSNARFDLVVLDPPWHNASVKRSRQYETTAPLHAADLLSATDLDMLLSDQCVVGVWITNKPSARTAVLGEDGIFAQWGVQLIEEWIWYKVTTTHALIFPMNTTMRKPYEVFLVGRKHRTYPIPPPLQPLLRRALLAVPDVHSRKPCLKTLLEQLLAVPITDYCALEVFARHLVAGWWSWGDECALFNERTNWKG